MDIVEFTIDDVALRAIAVIVQNADNRLQIIFSAGSDFQARHLKCAIAHQAINAAVGFGNHSADTGRYGKPHRQIIRIRQEVAALSGTQAHSPKQRVARVTYNRSILRHGQCQNAEETIGGQLVAAFLWRQGFQFTLLIGIFKDLWFDLAMDQAGEEIFQHNVAVIMQPDAQALGGGQNGFLAVKFMRGVESAKYIRHECAKQDNAIAAFDIILADFFGKRRAVNADIKRVGFWNHAFGKKCCRNGNVEFFGKGNG